MSPKYTHSALCLLARSGPILVTNLLMKAAESLVSISVPSSSFSQIFPCFPFLPG